MSKENIPVEESIRFKVLRSWTSLAGLILAAGSVFSFLFLFAIDFIQPNSNPYVGILAYLIAPGVFGAGVFLMILGLYLQRRRARKLQPDKIKPVLMFDLSKARDRRNLVFALSAAAIVLLFSVFGTYHSYHYTESANFCGTACHTAMKPEYVAYKHSPHARVSCSECHIGSGATSYMKAKLSGLHQVYAYAKGDFNRPVLTRKDELRPAQETCETCHWPQRYVGNLDRSYNRYLTDETNTLYSVRLNLHVGGGDPTHGPVSGIHWHMNVGNKVEYIATDDRNQVIPWVRMTDAQGVVTEYKTADFTGNPENMKVRTMDCMDCHNRPAHIFQSPNDAVDIALTVKRLNPAIPFIKKEAVEVLSAEYKTETEAHQKIATALSEKYAGHPEVKEIISQVQNLYSQNFFPEMKANWKAYPNNIGHKDWPGCFRCHDGEHKTADAKKMIKANDCNSCHSIIAQGKGGDIKSGHKSLEFEHPEEGWEGMRCHDCHTGTN